MIDESKSVLEMAQEWARSRHIELMGCEDGYSPCGHNDPIEQCQHRNCQAVRGANVSAFAELDRLRVEAAQKADKS